MARATIDSRGACSALFIQGFTTLEVVQLVYSCPPKTVDNRPIIDCLSTRCPLYQNWRSQPPYHSVTKARAHARGVCQTISASSESHGFKQWEGLFIMVDGSPFSWSGFPSDQMWILGCYTSSIWLDPAQHPWLLCSYVVNPFSWLCHDLPS